MKYDERLHLRLTKKQKSNLLEQSQRLDMGLRDYIILCCLDNPKDQADIFRKDIHRISNQLKHIGRNINQIAHRMHSGQNPDFQAIKKEFFQTMKKTNQILEVFK